MRVLLVNRQKFSRNAVEGQLKKLGHEVLPVETGDEAIERLNAGENFDVAVLDRNVPCRNCAEVFDEIKADEKLKGLPVIVYTWAPRLQPDIEKKGGIFADRLKPETLECALEKIAKK